MASNGYMRRICKDCLFCITHSLGCPNSCVLKTYDEYNYDDVYLKWLSALDYDLSAELRSKYDEPCEHFVDLFSLQNVFRAEFGLPTVEVTWETGEMKKIKDLSIALRKESS